MKTNLSERLRENLKGIGEQAQKHSPELAAVATIFCFGVAVYEAIKAAPKAKEELETKKKELNTEKLPVKETAKIVAKNFWKTGLSFAAGSALTVNAADKQIKLQKDVVNLVSEVSLGRAALNEFKAQMVEQIGEKKAEKVQYAVNQNQADAHPPVVGTNVSEKPKTEGNEVRTLIFEPQTYQYFWDDPSKFDAYVGRAIHKMGGSVDGELSLYDWLTELPSEVLMHIPDEDTDKLMHMVWTRDYPNDGFCAHLGDSYTVHDPNSPFYGCAYRRIEYDEDPIYTPSYY